MLRRLMHTSIWIPVVVLIASCGDDSTGPRIPSGDLQPPTHVATWGEAGAAPGPFSFPCGIDVAADGTVFVADNSNNRVKVISPDGELLGSFGRQGRENGQFSHPISVAIDPSGMIYVGDVGTSRIQRFTSSWEFDTTLAYPTDLPVVQPTFVDTDSLGFAYVVHSGINIIAKYSSSCVQVARWVAEDLGDVHFDYLYDLAIDSNGFIFVLDAFERRIHRFTSDGDSLFSWGESGEGPGELSWPAAIDIDEEGRVLVADRGQDIIHVFDRDGGYLLSWGESGSGPGQFDEPMGISAGPGGLIYVSEIVNNRLQVFRWE